jgi:glycerophosphoryl diester phosphodiesterase
LLIALRNPIFWFAAMFCAGSATRAAEPLRIIFHRGGVVDPQRPENSVGALEEAIRRGSWMVEMDIQESKDGRLVVHHDGFLEDFGDKRWPIDMTWPEIQQLRAKKDGSRVLSFEECAPLTRNRVRLMVDVKKPDHSQAFYQALEKVFRDNGLLDSVYMISDRPEPRAYFKGKLRVAVATAEIEAAMRAKEDTRRLYFLFEHAAQLERNAIELARSAGVPAVVSINVGHYPGQDHMKVAHADIVRLRDLGLTYFQIDSIYEQWLH